MFGPPKREIVAHLRKQLPPDEEPEPQTCVLCKTVCAATSASLCSGCKAVRYCSRECQKQDWKEHKEICKAIRRLVVLAWDKPKALFTMNDIRALIDAGESGGLEWWIQDRVREWRVDLSHPYGYNPRYRVPNARMQYTESRICLIGAYAKCGEQSHSLTAFKLAVENLLDMLCLTRQSIDDENTMRRHMQCIWFMIAADMDQEALNYLVHLETRRLAENPKSIPYLDLSRNIDLEDFSFIDLFRREREVPLAGRSPLQLRWYYSYMIAAHLMCKRVEILTKEKVRVEKRWKSFMTDTHEDICRESPLRDLKANHLLLRKVQRYCLGDLTKRIKLLLDQIVVLLTAVDQYSEYPITNLVDQVDDWNWKKNSIPYEEAVNDPQMHIEGDEIYYDLNILGRMWKFRSIFEMFLKYYRWNRHFIGGWKRNSMKTFFRENILYKYFE